MSKSSTLNKWLETGYDLFAQEGPEGLQIERLARILGLNKSGFYHYFGDMEKFSRQLIQHHYILFNKFLADTKACTNIEPEYTLVLLKHKITVMAQMHLVRNKSNRMFYGAHQELDDKVSQAVHNIWAKHINISNNPELVSQYFGIIRDMFYSRITSGNFNYEYLSAMAQEAKDVVSKIHTEKIHTEE
jgi:AcrR family transcriptional regulator